MWPSNSEISPTICELSSGASATVCAPGLRLSAPSYSGRYVIRTSEEACGTTDRRFGQQRLARRVDPMSVLDDVHGGLLACHHRSVDRRGQPTPSGVRCDIWQRRPSNLGSRVRRATTADRRHPLRGLGFARRPRHLVGEPVDPPHRTQQPVRHSERNIAGVRFAIRRRNLNAPMCRELGRLGDESALTDAGGPTTPATHPCPLTDRSSIAVSAESSHSRPTNVDVQ